MEKEIEFDTMTPEQKRVAIAKDVIEQLRARKYYAEMCTYLGTFYSGVREYVPDGVHLLRDYIREKENCGGVCGIGALFIASVLRADSLTMREFADGNYTQRWDGPSDLLQPSSLEKYMRRFFPKEQLDLIELAFESSEDDPSPSETLDWIPKTLEGRDEAASFWLIGDDNERLESICQNIIENGGWFKP